MALFRPGELVCLKWDIYSGVSTVCSGTLGVIIRWRAAEWTRQEAYDVLLLGRVTMLNSVVIRKVT